MRQYVSYYFSPRVAADVERAMELLELNYPSAELDAARAVEAFRLLREADARLPAPARESWRWRILYLRGLIDAEWTAHPEAISAARNDAYEELTRLYCAQRAGRPVAPPARSYFLRPDVTAPSPRFADHIGEHASDPSRIR